MRNSTSLRLFGGSSGQRLTGESWLSYRECFGDATDKQEYISNDLNKRIAVLHIPQSSKYTMMPWSDFPERCKMEPLDSRKDRAIGFEQGLTLGKSCWKHKNEKWGPEKTTTYKARKVHQTG